MLGVVGVLVCPPAQPPRPFPDCLDGAPRVTIRLPLALREVSGLTLGDDGRLWLHNDELGAVGALDLATGRPLASYRFGVGARGDFEGIALAAGRIYLVTSAGRMYSAPIPAPGTPDGSLAIDSVDTGLGRRCEIEGLAFEPADRALLLACKTPRTKALEGRVVIFRWSLEMRKLANPDRLEFAAADLARGRKGRQFRPSAIERHPGSGHYLILASADQAYAVVDRAGTVHHTGALGKRHRQPEGLAIGRSGEVVIADEGATGPGTVTVYACR
ncbi:MAG: hypothetical protein FJ206_10815 [Gemmatimonadetes bacterium]|nr:hypothetical protein [Gemmatimonadota bacterium]